MFLVSFSEAKLKYAQKSKLPIQTLVSVLRGKQDGHHS